MDIGVFANETQAKLALDNYVLDTKNAVDTQYIELDCFEVEGMK
mgnify:CR=1 FL=1